MDTRGADSYRHDLLMELFEEVCDLPPGDRAVRLDELCVGARASLRPELERLLEGDVVGDSLIDTKPTLAPAPRPETHRTIGRYRILGRLGEGGMGIVFEAEQENPKRRVALKVLKHHAASEDVERRFEHEASLLGRLHHPAVAQVYEAGIADGQRFIAMELVDGVRLDDYAADLGLEETLALVATVCDGVQHAHHNGVLHRDLKPANVLVEADGSPKILDFGVGRVLEREDNEEKTLAGEIIGTLAYMSPEQVQGDTDQIDTRCDVYALGVILYRFLAGAPPIDVSSVPMLDAVQRIVQDEPRPLRSHAPHVPADVAAIVHTAIAKEKERRYSSAAELASDLRRFLSGDTVSARPSTTWYVLSKFTRRNKGLVVASALVLLSLLLGLGAASIGFARAARERDRATEEVQAKDAVLEYLVGLLEVFDPETQGSTVTVREMLDVGVERLEVDLSDQPEVRLLLMKTIGDLYHNLGLPELAVALRRDIFTERRDVLGPDAAETLDAQLALATALVADLQDGDAAEILADLSARQERVWGREHPSRIRTTAWQANVLFEQRRFQEARATAVQALDASHRVFGPDSTVTLDAMNLLACVEQELRNFENAEQMYREAIARNRDAFGDASPRLLIPTKNLVMLLRSLDRFDEAERYMQTALEICTRVYGKDHPRSLETLSTLGGLYRDLGRYEDNFNLRVELVEQRGAELSADHPKTLLAQGELALAHADLNQLAEAASLLEDVIERAESVFDPEDPKLLHWRENLGGLYYALRRDGDAERLLSQILAEREKRYGHEHVETARCLRRLGLLYGDTGRRALAIERLESALDVLTRRLGEEHSETLRTVCDLATHEAPVDAERALDRLARAVDAGLSDASYLPDSDLFPLHQAEFEELVEAVRGNAELAK